MVIKLQYYLEDLLILVNICKELGIDYVHANELEIDGKLTGNYIGDIVDGKRKPSYCRRSQIKKAFISTNHCSR
jgi:phosphoserine phosphatase